MSNRGLATSQPSGLGSKELHGSGRGHFPSTAYTNHSSAAPLLQFPCYPLRSCWNHCLTTLVFRPPSRCFFNTWFPPDSAFCKCFYYSLHFSFSYLLELTNLVCLPRTNLAWPLLLSPLKYPDYLILSTVFIYYDLISVSLFYLWTNFHLMNESTIRKKNKGREMFRQRLEGCAVGRRI